MISPTVRAILKNTFSYKTASYSVTAFLCIWAMGVQMRYRVPSAFLFVLLPWIGNALGILSIIVLFNHLRSPTTQGAELRSVLARLEWWSLLLIRLFVYYSLVLYANAKLDASVPQDHPSEILSVSGEKFDFSLGVPYAFATLRSWDDPRKTKRMLLSSVEEDQYWGGEAVVVQIQHGYFGIPWISRFDRDDEKYSTEILNLAPTAALAWERRIEFYINHDRWAEGAMAAREFLNLYPGGFKPANDIAIAAAGELDNAGRYPEAISILDDVIHRHPSYEAYQLLGHALNWQGTNRARAAEALEASLALNPYDFEAYYHLGYVYEDMGKLDKALANFEKVLQIQPSFPEVQAKVNSLKQNLANLEKIRRRRESASQLTAASPASLSPRGRKAQSN